MSILAWSSHFPLKIQVMFFSVLPSVPPPDHTPASLQHKGSGRADSIQSESQVQKSHKSSRLQRRRDTEQGKHTPQVIHVLAPESSYFALPTSAWGSALQRVVLASSSRACTEHGPCRDHVYVCMFPCVCGGQYARSTVRRVRRDARGCCL